MFGKEHLDRLLVCAKSALEDEERYLAGCCAARNWKMTCGLQTNRNERYYQFLIWRRLMAEPMATFPWRSKTERRWYDLAFYDDKTDQLVAVAEIKGWWGDGKAELAGMKVDMRKLAAAGIKGDMAKLGTLPIPGVMLIITYQANKEAETNYGWLANELEVNHGAMKHVSFPVLPAGMEYAIIGFWANSTDSSLRGSA